MTEREQAAIARRRADERARLREFIDATNGGSA